MKKLSIFAWLVLGLIVFNSHTVYGQTNASVEFASHVSLPQVVISAGDHKTEWLWTGAHFTSLRLGRLRTDGVGVALSPSSPLLVVPVADVAIFQLVNTNYLIGTRRVILELDLNFNYVRNLKRKDNGIAVGLSVAF